MKVLEKHLEKQRSRSSLGKFRRASFLETRKLDLSIEEANQKPANIHHSYILTPFSPCESPPQSGFHNPEGLSR